MFYLYIGFMIQELLKIFVETGKFTAQEITVSEKMVEDWVQFRSNPQRFLPKIFDGDWAKPDRHPTPGEIKLVRIMPGNDGVYRVIGRQGSFIYATPWIGV
jgi:hypothetical protein